MATPQELALLLRSRRTATTPAPFNPPAVDPGNTNPGGFINPIPGQGSNRPMPLPDSLGNDATVNAAYRRLMSFQASGDAQKGTLKRGLTTNLDMSQVNRGRSLNNANQNFSDHGILNSGISLKKDADLNTQYDTTDRQMNNNYLDAVGGIDRQTGDYLQQFQDAQVAASQKAIQAKADAAAAQIAAQQQADQQAQQQAALLAAIQQSAYVPPDVPFTPTPVATPAPIAKKSIAAPAAKTAIAKKVSVALTQPKLTRVGGPQ